MRMEQMLVDHCAPTLAGLKTANMFQVRMEDGKDIRLELKSLNSMLGSKGLRAVMLKKSDKNALIYLYRPDCLHRDLCCDKAKEILTEKGYQYGSAGSCIAQLIRHIAEDDEFPHEIGLFLGYPPDDVKCFMEDAWRGVKCTGCWKAYGNEEEAKKTFLKYKKCTQIYRAELAKGRSLLQLTVRKDQKRAG